MNRLLMVLVVAGTPSLAVAQLATPNGWKWAADGPVRVVESESSAEGTADAMWFVAMPPGFHVTMGPGGVLYHPSAAAEQTFELESEFFLFPGDTPHEYGLVLGGRSLEGVEAGWIAFVARRDGSAAVLRRRAGTTTALREWKPSSAIVQGRADGTARNVLKVLAGPEVVFRVNGAEVARIPRDSVSVDGVVGLRVGKAVNVHVTSFDLLRRLAPTPPKR